MIGQLEPWIYLGVIGMSICIDDRLEPWSYLGVIGMSITIGDWLKLLGYNWYTNPYW